jgi:protocatechuate 3,4-dioxygenase beta subunit
LAKKGSEFHYQASAAAIVLTAAIACVVLYNIFARHDDAPAESTAFDRPTASTRSTQGWHAAGLPDTSRHQPSHTGNPSSLPGHPVNTAGAARPTVGATVATRAPATRSPASKPGKPTPLSGMGGNSGSSYGSTAGQASGADGGELSISGRVLDQNKEPVPSIMVTATKYPSQPGSGGPAGSGLSGNDGRYEISGLTEGEYQLITTATDRYRAAQATARAGFTSADIILEGDYEIRVTGTVTDTNGRPLAGVRVLPADSQRQTQTDGSGAYDTYLVIRSAEQAYPFSFTLKGYKDKVVYVSGSQVADVQETRVDAQLESLGDVTTVTGVVAGEDGTPVANASVQLQSSVLRTTYATVTGNDGRFSINDVKIGAGYRVTVFPRKGYQDYEQDGIEVTDGAVLDVALAPLNTGRLVGRMVDPGGNPIPRFSMWLSSSDAKGQAQSVTSDNSGSFVVDQAPTGLLTFTTRSAPQLTVSGIMLDPGDQQNVQLVLDWGDQVVEGRVLDNGGSAVTAAQVSLSWSAQIQGVVSSSSRVTSTDPSGAFRFTQLGPGPYMLNARSPGNSGGQQGLEVTPGTRNLEVRLP